MGPNWNFSTLKMEKVSLNLHTMKFLRIGFLIIILCMPACTEGTAEYTPLPNPTQGEDKPTQQIPDLAGVQIIYERSGGIAGTSDRWRVYGDGRFQSTDGNELTVSQYEIVTLLTSIEQLGFFELEFQLNPFSSCADCFTYRLSITYGNKQNDIQWRDGDSTVPESLLKVQELIRNFFILNPPIGDQ